MRAGNLVVFLLEDDPDAVDPKDYLLTTPPWWESLDDFTKAYIGAALWSTDDESTPSGGEPMDANYGLEDIDVETVRQMAEDCANFQRENADDLVQHLAPLGANWSDVEQGGHDFWLSRNGHGTGFFDRDDTPEDVRDRLQAAAKRYGETWLYVGDDGKIHA